jgi:hypothetical protein
MSKSLLNFYNDKETKEEVQNYLIDFLEHEAIKKVFAKEDVSAVSEAKEMIDKAFENMDLLFQSKVNKKEQINEAR